MNASLTAGCCTVVVSRGGSPVWVTIKLNEQEVRVKATDLPDIAHAIKRARKMSRVEMRRMGDTQDIELA